MPRGAGATPRSGPAGCWVLGAGCGAARQGRSLASPEKPRRGGCAVPTLVFTPPLFRVFHRRPPRLLSGLWTPRFTFPSENLKSSAGNKTRRGYSRPPRALPPPRPLQFKLQSPHRPCQARGPRGGAGHRRQRHRSPPRGPCGPPTSAGRPCSLRQQLRQ